MSDTDIAIVGSGPAGANAAKRAIEAGLSVTLIDVGVDERALGESIPPEPFSVLRATDPNQRRYFLGDRDERESKRNDRLSSHLTAPREYVTKDADDVLPISSETFFPVQSLALGGLGAGWGAEAQTYEPFELERAGLPTGTMPAFYDEVVRDIGVSGAAEDDTAAQVLATRFAQPPAEIDTNARALLAAYGRKRSALRAAGFNLGRESLAMLTQPLHKPGIARSANPYTDMDFYGTAAYSVYRPEYTITELLTHPKFRYISGALVQRFEETGAGVRVSYSAPSGGAMGSVVGKKLLLAAGALNSARIVLRSLGLYDVKLPLLSNQMQYIPSVNLHMLGRPAADRRHSLGQLCAVYTPQHRGAEHVILPIVSYRSLMHARIVAQMPVPAWLGVLIARALMTSLTIVGVHHPESASESKWIALRKLGNADTLTAEYRETTIEKALVAADIRGVVRLLQTLGCIPLAVFSTVPGASIHYAGTIPFAAGNASAPLASDPRGKLIGTKHVFLADSASWNYLPAKGPTLTIMANARRVAHEAAAEIGAHR